MLCFLPVCEAQIVKANFTCSNSKITQVEPLPDIQGSIQPQLKADF